MAEDGFPDDPAIEELRTTPLDVLNRGLGARMVAFAGHAMPLRYSPGIMAEHLHCRAEAALFDISHMGQVVLRGAGVAAALERLVPGDIAGLRPGRQRYTLLTNEAGGIIDDLMVGCLDADRFLLVVNAGRTEEDLLRLRTELPAALQPELLEDRALLALQGPRAVSVMARFSEAAARLRFMDMAEVAVDGIPCVVSRSGYTGEDGFEISVAASDAADLAERLLSAPEVKPAGLGARDLLRLEAGLPLYGNDIDELTSPVEAGLTWTVGKRRRLAWDFPGAAVVRDQLENGAPRHRVGLRLDGRAPARAGALIAAEDGTGAGSVTSGGFSPSLNAPIAMGYVRKDLAIDGTPLALMVRGKPLGARVAPLPFVPHRYAR